MNCQRIKARFVKCPVEYREIFTKSLVVSEDESIKKAFVYMYKYNLFILINKSQTMFCQFSKIFNL